MWNLKNKNKIRNRFMDTQNGLMVAIWGGGWSDR